MKRIKKARYYEFNDDGKIRKTKELEYGIYEDIDKQVLDIELWTRGKGIHCHVDIPLKDVFIALTKHTEFQDKIIKKRERRKD